MNLSELINLSNVGLSSTAIVVNLFVTCVLATLLFFVYKLTYSGVAYSKSFNESLVMTTVVTGIVMMVIRNNLALSLGMVGALSIVRFRSSVKEPKDISYIFWGIAIGLSAGTGAHGIAILGSFAMTAVTFIFHSPWTDSSVSYMLVIKSEQILNTSLEATLKQHAKKFKLKMQNVSQGQQEYVYEIKLKKNQESILIESLNKLIGVQNVNIVSYTGNMN